MLSRPELVFASSEKDPRFAALISDNFEILSPDRFNDGFENGFKYSDQLDELSSLDQPFSWIPSGKAPGVASPGCAPDKLEEILTRLELKPKEKAIAAQDFLSRCETELTRFYRWWVGALFKLEKISYDLSQNRNVRPVRITIPENIHVRGVLALKPDQMRRPLILIKCGLYCDSEDSPSTRMILMHLFDESPFNVLVLSNVTGVRFAEDNSHFSLGGFDEGRHLFLVAKLIRNSPLGEVTSSIHIAGISLGGHAALFAALYNDFNPASDGKSVISSSASLCPVVDLEATLRKNLSGGLRGKLFRMVTLQQIFKILAYIPILGELFDPDNPPGNRELREVVAKGALDYYRRLSRDGANWTLPPFAGAMFDRIEDLWTYNNFLSYQAWVRTPTLVWAAEDDGIVPASINAHALRETIERDPGAGSLQVIETHWGSHCGSSVTHGWETTSGFLRGYFLSHSPEFLAHRSTHRSKLFPSGIPKRFRLRRGELHLRQHWKARPGKTSLLVKFEIWSPYRDSRCYGFKPWGEAVTEVGFIPGRDCVRYEETEVELKEESNVVMYPPGNDTEAEALTRWANVSLRVISSSGKPVAYTATDPAMMEWDRYDSHQ